MTISPPPPRPTARRLALALLAAAACAPSGPRLEPLPERPFLGVSAEAEAELTAARAEVERVGGSRPLSLAELGIAWGELARRAHANELYETASLAYRNAERCAPDSIVWPYLRGHAELDRHEPEAALAAFERALEIAPADGLARVGKARALRDLGRIEEGLEVLDRRIEGAPSDVRALLLGAEMAAEAGRWEIAARRYERLLELQPAASRLWLPLGRAYRELGRSREAEQALARRGRGTVVAEDGRLAAVRRLAAGTDRSLLEAVSAFRVGRFDLAARGFEAALRSRPDDVELRTNLATTYLRMNDLARASAELARVLELDSGFAPAWALLGAMHALGGREAEAVTALRRSLELDPSQTTARSNLAGILLRSGDAEGALELYRGLGEADPEDLGARLGQAASLSRLGRDREAIDGLEAELARRGSDAALERALARLLAAAPEATVRDGERALALARSSDATDALSLETLAMALAETGDLRAAQEAQQRALAALPALAGADRARLEPRLRANLARYARGEPCRDPALE